MEEVKTEFKENTIAIDFDGVVHRYSKGFQGMKNVYDCPTEGTEDALKFLKEKGYRLIIVSSRSIAPIKEWLIKNKLENYFDDISNIKYPAKFYIDDHAIRFEKNKKNPWNIALEQIRYLENINEKYLVNSEGEGI
jgi:cobalamin biosynthesis Co2+ chelatase CbiK